MWKILQHYGVPGKIINIIQCIYSGYDSQVICDGSLTEVIQVRTGVRQGFLLWPILSFVGVLDWVTRQSYGTGRISIEWTLTRKIEDLDSYATDFNTCRRRWWHSRVHLQE